jgi:hypothetical protein
MREDERRKEANGCFTAPKANVSSTIFAYSLRRKERRTTKRWLLFDQQSRNPV